MRVTHENLSTRIQQSLGALASDVTDAMIVEWMFLYGHCGPGDLMYFSDGGVLACLRWRGQA